MAWRDTLLRGTFRGVPFEIEGHDQAGGRRLALHEYPMRDGGQAEDLGRRLRHYGLQAFVIGDDYMSKRDALVAALEAEGAGTLVHPYLGTLQVSVETFGVSERNTDGGMAVLDLSFVESGEAVSPSVTLDSQARALSAADDAQAVLAGSLAERMDLRRAPSFVTDGVANSMIAGVAALAGAGGVLGIPTSAAFGVTSAARALTASAHRLTRQPLQLATSLLGLSASVGAGAPDATRALAAFSDLTGFGAGLPSAAGTTPARVLQRFAQGEIVNLVRRAAAVEAVRAATLIDFATYDDAITARDSLAERLDQLALDAGDIGDDSGFQAMDSLRLAMTRDLNARGATLARLTTVTPVADLPSLVLAFQLYGDATRDAELVARNRLEHPGFVSGGQALRAVTYA